MGQWLTGDVPPANEYVCRCVRIPNDIGLVTAVSGALIELTKEYKWEQFGTLTPEECARIMTDMFSDYLQSEVCMIGHVFASVRATEPENCLLCDGSRYLKADYPDLWAIMPAIFEYDATNFVVPDLQERVVVGAGNAYNIGDTGGAATITLLTSQIPLHSHQAAQPNAPVAVMAGGALNAITSRFTGPTTPTAGGGSGGGGSHDNMQPYIVLNYFIVAK